jgi:hypothetical protein
MESDHTMDEISEYLDKLNQNEVIGQDTKVVIILLDCDKLTNEEDVKENTR